MRFLDEDALNDLISRKAAIDAVKGRFSMPVDNLIVEVIGQLPPVEPEREKGKWIPCTKEGLPLLELMIREGGKWYGFKCSNCNSIYKGNALIESPFCQKCGADMRGEQDETD